jgi:hypothetical protein
MFAGEVAKLGSRNKLLEKYANVTRHHQEKVMHRINHTLSELQAYKQVVDREFKVHVQMLTICNYCARGHYTLYMHGIR